MISIAFCVLAESVLGQHPVGSFAKQGDSASKINASVVAKPFDVLSIEADAQDLQELIKRTPDDAEQKEHDFVADGLVLLSFMFLRSMVALRSLDSQSGTNNTLWTGIAFAVITRCVAEGMMSTACELPPLGSIFAIATREAFHMYGLRLVLDNFLVNEC